MCIVKDYINMNFLFVFVHKCLTLYAGVLFLYSEKFCVEKSIQFVKLWISWKQGNGLISVIRTLLRRKQLLKGGMLTLNAVVRIQIMLNAQLVKIRQLSRKTPKTPQTRFGRS